MILLCVDKAHQTPNSEFSLPSRQSRKYMCIQVIVKKILPVALVDRNGPWATFYILCLYHFDLNSHFKNLNTSNTSLTLSEPHKPKPTLFTLSSKHDSMCHRKICIGRKIITENPEFDLAGNSEFSEFYVIIVAFLNCFT